jgi:hypothetical protein
MITLSCQRNFLHNMAVVIFKEHIGSQLLLLSVSDKEGFD